MHVASGEFIDSITMNNDLTGFGVRHGGTNGATLDLNLQTGEYITGISGRAGEFVDLLTFHTNTRRVDFGNKNSTADTFNLFASSGSEVCGFFGRSSKYLDKIGIIHRPRI